MYAVLYTVLFTCSLPERKIKKSMALLSLHCAKITAVSLLLYTVILSLLSEGEWHCSACTKCNNSGLPSFLQFYHFYQKVHEWHHSACFVKNISTLKTSIFFQGWEFAYRFSERIARFLRKNYWMSDSFKKTSDLLSRSFLVSALSDSTWSLIFGEQHERFAHGRSFLVSNLRDSLTSLIFGEQPERFAHIAHQKWGNERIAHFFK